MFFACNVGTRLQETLSLQFKQIKIHDFGAEVELIETKSGKKETIPINKGVVEMLHVIARERYIDFKFLTEKQREQYVFLGLHSDRLKSVRKPMQKTLRFWILNQPITVFAQVNPRKFIFSLKRPGHVAVLYV